MRVLLSSLVASALLFFQNCGKPFEALDDLSSANDPTVPRIQFTSPLTPIYNNRTSLRFEFEAMPDSPSNLSFECRYDNQAYQVCVSPEQIFSPTEGAHAFSVRARTPDGVYSNEISEAWVTDLTAPTVQLTSPPPGPVEFAGADEGGTGVERFECAWMGNFGPCASPFNLPDLASGDYSFQVRAVDRAGNTSEVASANFSVD
jgi:hypothetical protein